MNIRLQLINDSAPLVHGKVKVSSNTYTTDSDGFLTLELLEGQHHLKISFEDRILTRNIVIDNEQSHVIVDVTPRPTLEVVVEKLLGDRYKLKSILGRGGMGIVFKAEDRILNRFVAIKMLSGELEANEEAQHVFLSEARALAPLVHPNLVAIHDILSVDAHTFMVLEFIIGENLDSVIAKGPLDEMTALRYMLQLTRAIVFMHHRGFVHRDIKPGNAVVQEDGTLKIIDFGLAGSLDKMGGKMPVRGTPAYMAPEQILGNSITEKVDVYQIGIMLYELLASKLPFSGDLMYAHVHSKPELLIEQNVDISLEISNIVARCINKKPEKRPTSAELLDAFEALYLHGEDIDNAELNALLYDRIAKSSTKGSVNLTSNLQREGMGLASTKKRNGIIALLFLGLLLGGLIAWLSYRPKKQELTKNIEDKTILSKPIAKTPIEKTPIAKKTSVPEKMKGDSVVDSKPAEIEISNDKEVQIKKDKAVVDNKVKTETADEKTPKIDSVKKPITKKKKRKRRRRSGLRKKKKSKNLPTSKKETTLKEAPKSETLIKKEKSDDILLDHKKPKSEDILLK